MWNISLFLWNKEILSVFYNLKCDWIKIDLIVVNSKLFISKKKKIKLLCLFSILPLYLIFREFPPSPFIRNILPLPVYFILRNFPPSPLLDLPLWTGSFWKLFFYVVGDTWKTKNFKIWISQKWFEISTPNFHQLFTSICTRFVPNLKAFGALDLNFLPKMSKTSNGRSGSIFWATPFKFGENSFLP